MTREQIHTEVTQSLSAVLRQPIERRAITDSTDLFNDMGIDSLSIMDFILELEGRFGIVFDEEQLRVEVFEEVGLLIQFLQEATSNRLSA